MFSILAFFCLVCGLGVLPAVQCAKKKQKALPVESKQGQITQLVYIDKAKPAALPAPATPAAAPAAAKAQEKADGSKKNDSAKSGGKRMKPPIEGVKPSSEVPKAESDVVAASNVTTKPAESGEPVQSTVLDRGPSATKLATGATKPAASLL